MDSLELTDFEAVSGVFQGLASAAKEDLNTFAWLVGSVEICVKAGRRTCCRGLPLAKSIKPMCDFFVHPLTLSPHLLQLWRRSDWQASQTAGHFKIDLDRPF